MFISKVMPFYLIVDVSWSMAADGKLEAANAILPALVDTVAVNPVLADLIRVGVIDFADDAQVLLPLSNLYESVMTPPTMDVRGGTAFSPAFRTLRQEIEADITQLRADGYEVHRPIAWFLCDGQPSDTGWNTAFAELIANRAYPYMIPCGFDQADQDMMKSLIHPRSPGKAAMYWAGTSRPAASAIEGFTEIIVRTMVQSTYSLVRGSSGTILPPRSTLPAGIIQIDATDGA